MIHRYRIRNWLGDNLLMGKIYVDACNTDQFLKNSLTSLLQYISTQ